MAARESDNKPIRILLVEDDPVFARSVERIISQKGAGRFQHLHADTLEKAFRFLDKNVFDVIFLDLKLPDSPGFETLSRTRERASRIPIIVLTGIYQEEMANRAFELGATEYFYKPNMDANSLLLAVRYAIERTRAEKALEESEERYRSLIESTSDWIWEVDENTRYVYVSPMVTKLLGYEPEYVIGKTPFDFMPEKEAERVSDEFRTIAEERRPFDRLENTALHRDGRLVVLETSGVPIFDERGRYRGYRGIDRDITERKRAEKELEASERRFRDLFQGIGDAVIVHSPEGRVLDYNEPTLRLWGYEHEEIPRLSASDILHPDFDQAMRKNQKRIWAGETTIVESKHRRKDGTFIPVEIESRKIDYHNTPAILSVVRDITERKQAEELRTRFIEKVLMAQDEERRRIARELHDQIGSALTSIAIGLRTLEDVASLQDTRPQIETLKKITNRTVKDVSLLARGLHPVALEQLGFAAAIRQYADGFSQLHGLKTHLQTESLPDDLPQVISVALYRIAQELLNNVAKHARAENVSIVVSREKSEIIMVVEDDGKGIEGSSAPDRTSKKGIGLHGIRERATLLGGSLDIESTPGGGTTLIVRIPFK